MIAEGKVFPLGVMLIVYVAVAVSLSVMSLLKALALIVKIPLFTWIGLEYTVEVDEGSEPSVVYFMIASLVLQLSVTLWGEGYVPAGGLAVGGATFPGGMLIV